MLWDQGALDPVVKERMRIALAEEIGCSYCVRFRTDLRDAVLDRAVSDADDRKGQHGRGVRRAPSRAVAATTS